MFTIRVYGLLVHAERVLVSEEVIKGRPISKFPGGGLEYGEGLKDCLVREIREEMGLEANGLVHFYTTDFFQQSAFHSDPMQVVSVYYRFQVNALEQLPLGSPVVHEGAMQPGGEVFLWRDLSLAAETAVSLPIDRVVWRMLQQQR